MQLCVVPRPPCFCQFSSFAQAHTWQISGFGGKMPHIPRGVMVTSKEWHQPTKQNDGLPTRPEPLSTAIRSRRPNVKMLTKTSDWKTCTYWSGGRCSPVQFEGCNNLILNFKANMTQQCLETGEELCELPSKHVGTDIKNCKIYSGTSSTSCANSTHLSGMANSNFTAPRRRSRSAARRSSIARDQLLCVFLDTKVRNKQTNFLAKSVHYWSFIYGIFVCCVI